MSPFCNEKKQKTEDSDVRLDGVRHFCKCFIIITNKTKSYASRILHNKKMSEGEFRTGAGEEFASHTSERQVSHL